MLRKTINNDFSKETNREIIMWLNTVLNKNMKTDDDLIVLLKDGVILCEVAKQLLNINSKLPHKSTSAFFCMENIEFFIKALRNADVPDQYNFKTVDLWEEKNIRQVQLAIIAFSRAMNKKNKNIPVIGPQEKEYEKKDIFIDE